MTKRRVAEMEVHFQQQEVRLKEQEVRLKEQEVRLKEQEVRLKKQEVRLEEKAEHQPVQVQLKMVEDKSQMERQRLREAIQKMHRTHTLMLWLLIYVPVLLVVVILVGYHQGLLPPILAIMLSYVLCLFSVIHYHVL